MTFLVKVVFERIVIQFSDALWETVITYRPELPSPQVN